MTSKAVLLLKAMVVGFGLSWTGLAQAQSAGEKLDAALAEFEELSQSIANEKLPLAQSVNQKRSEVASLRIAIESLLLQQSRTRKQLEQAQSQQEALAAQINFTEALLVDHSMSFESFLTASEDQRYRESVNTARADVRVSERLETRLDFIDLSLQRIQDKIQDPHFKGEAVDSEGTVVPGQFVTLGPLNFFLSDDGKRSGQAVAEINSLLPVIKAIPQLSPDEIKKFSKGQPAQLPLDPTLGKAREIDKAQWTLADQIEKGGKVGYIIIAFALVALVVSLLKTIQLYRIKVPDTSDFQTFLRHLEKGDNSQAESYTSSRPAVAIPFLKSIAQHFDDSLDVIEERLLAHLSEARRNFEKRLPILAIVAATAPLLGLLGTVVGMIKTFALINVYGSGEAKAFSAGISEALVTTEFGLIVAIPALILHGILKRYALQQLGSLEDFASNLMVAIRRDRDNHSPSDD